MQRLMNCAVETQKCHILIKVLFILIKVEQTIEEKLNFYIFWPHEVSEIFSFFWAWNQLSDVTCFCSSNSPVNLTPPVLFFNHLIFKNLKNCHVAFAESLESRPQPVEERMFCLIVFLPYVFHVLNSKCIQFLYSKMNFLKFDLNIWFFFPKVRSDGLFFKGCKFFNKHFCFSVFFPI